MTPHEIYRDYRSAGRGRLESGILTYIVMPTLSAVMLGSLAVSIGALWVVSKLAGSMPGPGPTRPERDLQGLR